MGDDKLIGEYKPSFARTAQYEMAGQFVFVSVRDENTGELVGYYVGTLSHAIKNVGKVLSETGLYLAPEVRGYAAARRLLGFVETVARALGCDVLDVSHRPTSPRIGKLYERLGFAPVSVNYAKRLT